MCDRDLERPRLGWASTSPASPTSCAALLPTSSCSRRSAGCRLADSPAALGMQRCWAFKHLGWPRPEGLAVLTPHRLVAARSFVLRRATVVGLAAADRHQRRGRSGGTMRLNVINVHLSPHDDGDNRRREAALVVAAANRLPRLPVIAGDFNDAARRPRAGRSGALPGGQTRGSSSAWTTSTGRRTGQQAHATAARPPSDSTTSSCRLAGRWSTPRCWRSAGAPRLVRRAFRSPANVAAVIGTTPATMSEARCSTRSASCSPRPRARTTPTRPRRSRRRPPSSSPSTASTRPTSADALAHGSLGLRRIAVGRGAYVRARLALLDAVARNHDCEVVFETGRHRDHGGASPATSPISTSPRCCTRRCTPRRRARWPESGCARRRRRSAGGGRSSSGLPTASPSSSPRREPGRPRRR